MQRLETRRASPSSKLVWDYSPPAAATHCFYFSKVDAFPVKPRPVSSCQARLIPSMRPICPGLIENTFLQDLSGRLQVEVFFGRPL